MAQVTGRQLKVGDVVRGALCSLRVDKSDRPLGPMLGVVSTRMPRRAPEVRIRSREERSRFIGRAGQRGHTIHTWS